MGWLRFLATLFTVAVLLFPFQAGAEEKEPAKTFAVLPFTVNGPEKFQYLSRGIQDMMISRLNWEGHLHHVDKDKVAERVKAAPVSEEQSRAMLSDVGADYLLWGSVTIMDQECSIDVNVADKEGSRPKNAQTSLSGLIPALETMAGQINGQIFGRPAETEQAEKQLINRMNPDLVYNERSASQEFYLNPQFRYAGGAETPGRRRTPKLPFASMGMVAGDADGDGKTELFFIDEHTVHAYRYQDLKMVAGDKITPSARARLLNINLIDVNRDGYAEIVVSGEFEGSPRSFVLNYKDEKFSVVEKDIMFYMNVVKLPPFFSPVLLGQKKGSVRLFDAHVQEVVRMSGEFSLSKRVSLPEKANVFNFTFLPQPGDDYKVLVLDNRDHLMVYTKKFELQATTQGQFAGSAIGFEYPDTFPGFGGSEEGYMNTYYLPLRMIPVNLDQDDTFEILVNKNVSVAAQFFRRYRFFPQGEIHSLFWDGVGLSLAWKTRRIKGTVIDYGVADVDNSGDNELYVCLNTYPGATGLAHRKAMVIFYSLDQTAAGKKPAPVQEQEAE
ncbi:MAG: VCBS repeat-containing protein [Thermodesulfobacteriota bacterium]|nr:VCBS repeat-containing protein [Thermodesulfobacteriota bacterium]